MEEVKESCSSSDKRLRLFESPHVSLTVLSAQGNRIQTAEYGTLVDMESGCWAAVLGHAHPEILATMSSQSVKSMHLHQFFTTEHSACLTQEVTDAAGLPCDYDGTYLSSGSEAVSMAVWMAEKLTQRRKKLCTTLSYLGTSSELRMPRDPKTWVDLNVTECIECDKKQDCESCGKFKNVDFMSCACFVFEAGNAGGRVLCPPEKLISYLTKRIRSTGGVVVSNEVTTGFGRTGRWFGFQYYDCLQGESHSPEIIAMGKGLGNGYPISGVLIRSQLGKKMTDLKLRYVQSHIDDPLGCAVARKVIEVMKRGKLIERGSRIGEYLRQKLQKLKTCVVGVKEIRGRGMMNVIDLEADYMAEQVFEALLNKGYFTGYSPLFNFIHCYAPLTLGEEEVDGFVLSLKQILEEKK